MKHRAIIGLGFFACSTMGAFALIQQPVTPSGQRESSTPRPTTPVWETERDLIVAFENADDRLALAEVVMFACLDPMTTLSPLQRRDGLSIAGHTFWREGAYQHCIMCFEGVADIHISDDDLADAMRMIAQSLAMRGEYQQAADAYQICHSISKQLAASGSDHDLYKITILPYIQSAIESGNTQLAFDLTDELMSNVALYNNDTQTLARALELAGKAALESDDLQLAEHYLSTLLDTFPEYGLEYPGNRINIAVDLLEARGFSFESGNQLAVLTMTQLLSDEPCQGMPVWNWRVRQLSELLDRNVGVQSGIEFRTWAAQRIDEAILDLDPSDPSSEVKQRTMRMGKLALLNSSRKALRKLGNDPDRIAILQTIANNFADLDPSLAQSAQHELDRLSPQPTD